MILIPKNNVVAVILANELAKLPWYKMKWVKGC